MARKAQHGSLEAAEQAKQAARQAGGGEGLAGDGVVGVTDEAAELRLARSLSWQEGPGRVWEVWIGEAARELDELRAAGVSVPISPRQLVEGEIVGFTYDFISGTWRLAASLLRDRFTVTDEGQQALADAQA